VGTLQLAVVKTVTRPRRIFGATLVIWAMWGGAAAFAAPATPADALAAKYCPVKNPAARGKCQEAQKLLVAGQYRSALVSIKAAAALSPKEGVLNVTTARIMYSLGSSGPAERELRQARLNGAPDALVLPILFNVMLDLHKEVNLLNEFPEPAKNAQGEIASAILLGRAQALQSLDKLPDAAAAADRAISLKRSSSGLLTRARIALAQNDTAMADKLVDEAFTLDPINGGVMRARLKRLQRSGDMGKTLAYADQILKVYPKTIPEARIARIEIFLKQNDTIRAKQEADAFFATSKMFGTYYRAVLLSRAKDKKNAANAVLSLPKEFVKAHPEYAPQMAQIVIDNGNIEPGVTILGYAIAANPNFIDARLRLAGLRMGQGSPQAALGALAPVESSGDPRVQKLLAEVRAKIAKDRAF